MGANTSGGTKSQLLKEPTRSIAALLFVIAAILFAAQIIYGFKVWMTAVAVLMVLDLVFILVSGSKERARNLP